MYCWYFSNKYTKKLRRNNILIIKNNLLYYLILRINDLKIQKNKKKKEFVFIINVNKVFVY
jgi:hypothetical protein